MRHSPCVELDQSTRSDREPSRYTSSTTSTRALALMWEVESLAISAEPDEFVQILRTIMQLANDLALTASPAVPRR